jgi:predicted hotdog family 3-hydroxylacyl-ACP dehydratase
MVEVIGPAAIAELIPHAGPMCLVNAVRCWDATTIICAAAADRGADHPLAYDGRLDAICGIEYAAQAMAIHGGLTATKYRRPRAGYLASVRDVICYADRIDTLAGELEVAATLRAGGLAGAVYDFVVRCGTTTVLRGRATVVIDPGTTPA